MTTAPMMMETDLDLDVIHRGKVRDLYALGDDRLLLVATDRVSAFDVVLPNPVPRKGEVLTRTSEFWFDRTSEVVPNAFIAVLDASNAAELGVDCGPEYFGRSMVMHRAEVLPVLERTYGRRDARRWLHRWRVFFMACAELFGHDGGREWLVAHYLLERTARRQPVRADLAETTP